MYTTQRLLIVGMQKTGSVLNPRTKAVYTTINTNELEDFAGTTMRIVGPVYFDPSIRRHLVKSASGFSDLKSWF